MDILALNSLNFIEANNKILNLVNNFDSISNNVLKEILDLKEKELISTFLENYTKFKKDQIIILEDFIDRNLDIDDREFVSDLIDFASDWSLNIDYKKLINFLESDEEKEHFVVLSTINYITENIKLFYVKEIINSMRKILNNSNFYQNVQISAALCLFRITHNKEYLLEIRNWFDVNENREFINNKLKLEYYNKEYFLDIKSILNL